MRVFVDTSAFYAFLVQSEAKHRDVLRSFEEIVDGGDPLCTTSYVVLETVALLQQRLGLPPVRELHEYVLPLVDVGWVTQALHRRALARLFREDRRSLSLVDCVSLEYMREEGVGRALALDPDLADDGCELWPR